MKEATAVNSMQIILHAGNAREKTMSALDALSTFEIDKAKQLLKEAETEIVEAHVAQTVELQREANGEEPEYTVLLTHAQDTCMSVNSEINITKKLVDMIEALDQRIGKLEK
nr:PTS lactose/cellobiose transporter subunit IIA [Clostridia bacterium]